MKFIEKESRTLWDIRKLIKHEEKILQKIEWRLHCQQEYIKRLKEEEETKTQQIIAEQTANGETNFHWLMKD